MPRSNTTELAGGGFPCAIFAALASFAGVGSVEAQTAPRWEKVPDARAIAHFYPAEARRQGVEGRAMMRCYVAPTNARLADLSRCEVVEETALGFGFGQAVLSMAPLFKMKFKGSPPEGGWVGIPITFKLPTSPDSKVP